MNKIIISISILLLIQCNNKTDDNINLVGNWYYIDPNDSSYNELYFSTNLHYYNLYRGDIGPVFNYKIINDSIFISIDAFVSSNNFIYKIKNHENKEFLFYNSTDTIIVKKIPDTINRFYDLHIGELLKNKLRNERLKKDNSLIKKNKENMDSLEDIIIPEPDTN